VAEVRRPPVLGSLYQGMEILDDGVQFKALELLCVVEPVAHRVGPGGALVQDVQPKLLGPPVRVRSGPSHRVFASNVQASSAWLTEAGAPECVTPVASDAGYVNTCATQYGGAGRLVPGRSTLEEIRFCCRNGNTFALRTGCHGAPNRTSFVAHGLGGQLGFWRWKGDVDRRYALEVDGNGVTIGVGEL
jgi:hypothetical protein